MYVDAVEDVNGIPRSTLTVLSISFTGNQIRYGGETGVLIDNVTVLIDNVTILIDNEAVLIDNVTILIDNATVLDGGGSTYPLRKCVISAIDQLTVQK